MSSCPSCPSSSSSYRSSTVVENSSGRGAVIPEPVAVVVVTADKSAGVESGVHRDEERVLALHAKHVRLPVNKQTASFSTLAVISARPPIRSGPVLVDLLIKCARAVSVQFVERRLRQELFGVELHEVLCVPEGDRNEGFQHGIDDVQHLKMHRVSRKGRHSATFPRMLVTSAG